MPSAFAAAAAAAVCKRVRISRERRGKNTIRILHLVGVVRMNNECRYIDWLSANFTDETHAKPRMVTETVWAQNAHKQLGNCYCFQ